MSIRAVVFDIGQTLVFYPVPLNWSAFYRPAFESIAEKNGLVFNEEEYEHIGKTLAKYNTRINPRTKEISSDVIFAEILDGTTVPAVYKEKVKNDFYRYFRREVRLYDEVHETLTALKARGIFTATFSDVPYGMDNEFAFEDIKDVIDLIDMPFTSNDAGLRKPDGRGLMILSEKSGIKTSEMIFAGDEKKDIECALDAGAVPVLINRDGESKSFGQAYTIKSLNEISALIDSIE
ncbi:MAG: HAD family hydrolase [Ruminococcus sp.]|nr:HAD family hydrolase [Ruminococcus sp.]